MSDEITIPVSLKVFDLKPETADGAGTIDGGRHRDCNAIALAALTPQEQAAFKDQLAQEIGQVLRDDPKQVEIRPDVFASREEIATCFDELRAAKVCFARVLELLNHIDNHPRVLNLGTPLLDRITAELRSAGIDNPKADIPPDIIEVAPKACPACMGPGHRDNTKENPCPKCGCPF